jgi:prepilin-type N-terminal cleavage/methylation domain-containing protein
MMQEISPLPDLTGRSSATLSLRVREKGKRTALAGFTLLEVMIAVGVLGFAMLALLSLHDSNLQAVIRGQELSTAAVLAQGMMSNAELERVPIVGITKGDFQKLFPGVYRGFKWQRTVEMSGMFPDIRKVQVTIFYGPRFRHNFSVVEYIHDPTPQNTRPRKNGPLGQAGNVSGLPTAGQRQQQ